jgi:hypothetical protein
MALLVQLAVVGQGAGARRVRRDHRRDTIGLQRAAEMVGVECGVGDQSPGRQPVDERRGLRRQVTRDKLPDEAGVHPESIGAAIWGEGYGIHSLPAAFFSERYFLPPL